MAAKHRRSSSLAAPALVALALALTAAWSCGGGDTPNDGADGATDDDTTSGADGSLDGTDDAEPDDAPLADTDDGDDVPNDADPRPDADADPGDGDGGTADILEDADGENGDALDAVDGDAGDAADGFDGDVAPEPVRCADLGCAAQFRACVDVPTIDSICEECLPGYAERDGVCTPDIRCSTDVECGEPAAGEWGACVYDGECSERGLRERAVTSFVCASGECVDGEVALETDDVGCRRFAVGAECADGAGRCSPDATCVLPPRRVTGVDASDGTRSDAVNVSWSPVDGAARYQVLRQGEVVAEVTETSYVDTTAPAALPPVVAELTASFDRADGVALDWSVAELNEGTAEAYTVVARNDVGDGAASLPDDGWRAGAPVVRYVWASESGEPVDAGTSTSALDTGAALARIVPGTVSASDATFADRVVMQVTPASTASVTATWRVRAESADGVGEWTTAVGTRAAGDLSQTWQRTNGPSAAGPFTDLPAAGAVALSGYIDLDAPASGEERYYRVRYEAPGASSATTEPDAGRRAVLGAAGTSCTANVQCGSGNCVDGVCCNSTCTGTCVACNLAGLEGTCSPIAVNTDPGDECSVRSATSCDTTGVCDGAGACTLHPVGTVCSPGRCADPANATTASVCDGLGTCQPGTVQSCGGFACERGSGVCLRTCGSDTDCAGGLTCNRTTGVCARASGQTCTAGSQCSSGFCTDGVCCESACTGTCSTCNAAGRLGFCDPIAAGLDPANECTTQAASTCGTTGTCSGARSCALYPASTTCAAPLCVTATDSQGSRSCNGTGTCNVAVNTSCIPYACNSAAGACRAFCVTAFDCASGFTCNLNRKRSGQPVLA